MRPAKIIDVSVAGRLSLANIPSGQKPLTSASPLGTLQAMRGGFRTGATDRAAEATRMDLLLETLALRHQLGVVARSHRRFRSTDRLLWLVLRWLWPRWREALVLVQPVTVDRWHRDRFVRRWWLYSARSRSDRKRHPKYLGSVRLEPSPLGPHSMIASLDPHGVRSRR